MRTTKYNKCCVVCKTAFQSSQPATKMCSLECRKKRKSTAKIRPPRNCNFCGKTFIPRAHNQLRCSRRCTSSDGARKFRAIHKGYYNKYKRKGKHICTQQELDYRKQCTRITQNRISKSRMMNITPIEMQRLEKDIIFLQQEIEKYEQKAILIENKLNQTKYYKSLKTGENC